MLKPISALIGVALLAGALGAPALAAQHKAKPAVTQHAKPAKPAKAAKAMPLMTTMKAASGTKVFMDMSSSVRMYTKDHASRAAAAATIYTNRDGALTGLTIQSWGLPDPERMDARTSRYMVWLVDERGQRVRKLGQLESHNGSKAVFGFTPERPVTGYARLMITAEAMDGVSRPSGMMHMSADLPGAHKVPRAK
jgi:hypothetical protein